MIFKTDRENQLLFGNKLKQWSHKLQNTKFSLGLNLCQIPKKPMPYNAQPLESAPLSVSMIKFRMLHARAAQM